MGVDNIVANACFVTFPRNIRIYGVYSGRKVQVDLDYTQTPIRIEIVSDREGKQVRCCIRHRKARRYILRKTASD